MSPAVYEAKALALETDAEKWRARVSWSECAAHAENMARIYRRMAAHLREEEERMPTVRISGNGMGLFFSRGEIE